jgi:hypothetical protein
VIDGDRRKKEMRGVEDGGIIGGRSDRDYIMRCGGVFVGIKRRGV